MNIRFQYTDAESRQMILNENSDKYLIEEHNITEGSFLVFSDTPPEKPTPSVETVTIPKTEYEELQNQLLLAVNENIEGGIF